MTNCSSALAAALMLSASAAVAQTSPPAPLEPGRPLGVVANGAYTPMTSRVKVFGSFANAESCSYDTTRNLIVVPSRGAEQNQIPNDGFVSLINHDGSVHTVRWIGENRTGLTLNHPAGSDIQNGKLYLADRDGGTAPNVPSVAVIRIFDMTTGAPAGEIRVPDSPGINDVAVARDGTIYGTQTRDGPFRIYRITPDGRISVFKEGAPLNEPNGVALDPKGNIVVVNIGDNAVMTFAPSGQVLAVEQAAQPGNDGLVITADGTKYVSSVRNGGISRIRAGARAELIAQAIPSAASMCFDPVANQLVVPMNPNNALAFVKLD